MYNIRGWLTSKENDYFRMKLRYCDPVQSTSEPSYTGNISEWSWRHGAEGDENTYGFTYDDLSRLKNTNQFVNGTPSARFVEVGMIYDLNGNLKNLFRLAAGVGKNIFQYTYTGNRLTGLQDGLQQYSYGYDLNGNMTRDGMNGLDLSYNRQNLVEKVEKNGVPVANYCYLSDGMKLSAVNGSGNGLVYSGSLVYNKQGGVCSLESAAFTGGRFVASSTGFTPHYFVTDHLGSVRAIVNDIGGVEEQSNYYPFGSRWNDGQISDNRYGYNGKEKQLFVNLPYSDYGARQYDPVTGRWFNLDRLAEIDPSISPYVFCANNPIRYIDPNGMKWLDPKDKKHADIMNREADKKLAELSADRKKKEEKKKEISSDKKLKDDKKNKKLQKVNDQINMLDAQINMADRFISGLSQIETDQNTTYTFNISPGQDVYELGSMENGTIIINSDGSDGNMVHETTHAIQHVRGEIQLVKPGSNLFRASLEVTEVNAYATQYVITGSAPSSIRGGVPQNIGGFTPRWVGGILDAKGQPVYPYLFNKYP